MEKWTKHRCVMKVWSGTLIVPGVDYHPELQYTYSINGFFMCFQLFQSDFTVILKDYYFFYSKIDIPSV